MATLPGGLDFQEAESETSAVQVAVRVRPFNPREIRASSNCVIRMSSNTTTIVHPTSVSKPFDEQDVHTFAYDYSYWSFAPRRDHVDDVDDEPSIDDQEVIFNDLGRTILSNAYRGYNCSLLAYGQTGAGKTFSMMGGKGEQRGLIPRICEEFFSERESESTTYKVEVSYLEIYSERIRDLLNPSTSRAATRRGSIAKGLRVREHPETGPYVEDLSRFAVNDYEELEGLMNIGNKERTVASTNMNATSSRSHAVFTIVFTQTRYDSVTNMSSDIVAKVQLVDLAGSERVDVSGVKGIHLKEAANINKSLTTLGRVIQALAKASESNAPRGGTLKRRKSRMRRRKTRNPDDVFIPFRDSVLTWLLKDSLGGNSKTIMIAAISPADVNYEETLSTLRYAARAKKIVNKAVVNEDPNAKIIRVLRKEIDDLRRQLESQSQSGGQDDPAVEELREQLAQSQKIIADINRSWEQKLQHSRDVQLQRIRELEQQGVAVSFNSDVPYLINLNEDPSMSESVLYHIQPGEVHVGRKKTDGSAPCIVLRGLKVQDHHAIFENHGNEVTVRPYDVRSMPAIYLNGELIITERQMYHGDRIIFGQNHVFRFCLPRSAGGARTPPMGGRRASGKEDQLTVGTPDRGRSRSISSVGDIAGELMRQGRRNTDAALDWEFATRERTITMGGVDSVMGAEDSTREKYRLLEEKLKIVEREKLQNATLLRQQQDEYRRLLQHFQVSAEGIDGYSDLDIEAMMAGGGLLKRSPSEEERFRAEEEARAALRDGLLHVIPLVEEGNAICEDLQRDVSFEIELITEDSANAPSFELDSEAGVVSHAVSPLQRLRLRKATHIFIKVRRGKGTRFSLWSEDEFVEKLVALRELHHLVNEYGEEEANSLPDPLAPSTLEIQRIGVAHIYLESLRYGVGVQQRSQILDRRGDFVGLLTVQIHCTEDGLEELEPVEAEFDEMEANLSIAAQRRQEQEHLRVRKEEQERGRSIQAGSPLFPRRSAVRSADSDESYLAGDGVDFNESEPPSVAASGRASPTESDVSAVTDGSLDRNDMFQTVERTAGRFRTLREVESQVPEVGKPLPITLRVSRVDRLPATGIRDVVVKYQFFKDRHAYQTKACQVTPHHTDGGSIESEQFGVEIRRRRFSSRISSPLHFNYVARHDQPAVTDELLRYFKTNAIAFEIWGRFDTTAVRTLGNHRQSIIGSLPLFLPITPQPTPPGTPERSRSPVADVRIIKPRRGSSDDTDGEPPQSGTLSLPRSPRGDPSGALTPRRAHGRHTSLGPAGAKSNLYFVAVDVEERDPQGRYNPCQVKASPGDDPANVFRVTAGSERPKRFVISCMQVDPHDFILESAATCEVVALTSELRARSAADVASAVDGLVSSVSSGDLADDASSHSSTAASPNIPINRKLPSVRERSDHFPINMDVWDQNYQIRNKMLTIYSEWPRELSEQMLLRRVTSPGERIVIDVSTSFYLSKMTDPVVISTRVAVKVYEPSTTVSTMRSFFRHVSPDRLFTIGNYFRLTRVKTKDVSLTILDMHKQQRAKLEHSMRIEQTQQHITLIKVLEAINSTKVKEAQLGFETSLERMRAMSALEAPELDADIQHEQRASSPVSGIRTIVTVDRIPSQDTVVKSGKLLKRGKFHTTWKRRWFVLRPPYLFYYKHASDRKHKGVVDLIGASISFGTKEQQERDPNSFEIHATTRVWYLRAPDNKSMQAWIEAILEFGD